MITTVYYKPSYLQGAYNPIVWSVLSNKTTEVDFKYVFDVYVNGVFQTRLKQRPNPSGAGMIDVSTISQAYLVSGPPNGPWTQGETTIDPTVGHAYQDNGTLSIHLYLKVGEEYADANGDLFIYNGVTNVVGPPAYNLYSGNTAYPGGLLPVHVFSSSVEYQLQQWGMSNQFPYSGAYGKNPIDSKNYDWGNAFYIYNETAASLNHTKSTLINGEMVEEYDMYSFDRMVLSYINYSPYANNDNLHPIYGFKYTFKNSAGATAASLNLPIYTDTGCGPRTLCSTPLVTKQLLPQYDIVHVLAGPDQVADLFQYWVGPTGYVPVPGDTLEIQGFTIGGTGFTVLDNLSRCTYGAAITQKVKIKINEYCPNPLYPRVRLSWLNDLGGRDYLNFTMFLEKDVSTTSESYSQEQINWAATTPVPLGVLDPSQYLMLQGGTKVYNKMANTSWSIQSDFLEQDQVDLLEGLQKSPQVFAYIHQDGNPFSDYTPYPVTITGSSYKVKNVKQVKLVQGEFTIALTIPQKLQNT
jgi:hypothetical protein